MEFEIAFRNDDEARRESLRLRLLKHEASQEGLSASIAAPDKLEAPRATFSERKLPLHFIELTIESHGERADAALGDTSVAKRLEEVCDLAFSESGTGASTTDGSVRC